MKKVKVTMELTPLKVIPLKFKEEVEGWKVIKGYQDDADEMIEVRIEDDKAKQIKAGQKIKFIAFIRAEMSGKYLQESITFGKLLTA